MRLQVRRITTRSRRLAGVTAAGVALVLVSSGVSYGAMVAPTTATPSTPFAVPGDTGGNPKSFDVVASGFAPGNSAASVQQCDGVPPTEPGYQVLDHCDSATSPAAVDVGLDGLATFPANDVNFGFTPFKGTSPQAKFNCIAPGDANPGNGLPTFTNCQLRVASDLNNTTGDEAYRTLTLPTLRTNLGCTNFVQAVKVAPALADQTAAVVESSALMSRTVEPKTKIGGTCTTGGQGGAPATVTPKALSMKLGGNTSCASTAAAITADATKATAYRLNGKGTVTMNELNPLGKPWQIQMYLSVGRDAVTSDVMDVTGIVIKGVNVGATVKGTVWQAPIVKLAKTDAAQPGLHVTGHALDLTQSPRVRTGP